VQADILTGPGETTMQTTMTQSSGKAAARPKALVTKILVPFDFGDPAIHALEYAKELARQFGASLDVVHVVTVPYVLPVTDGGFFELPADFIRNAVSGAEKELKKVAGADAEPLRVRATVKTGDPRTGILEYAAAEKVDLIVMGTRGRTGASHLVFGSVAEHVVRTAPCPVLTVR
jgi:nucleotide-binding universal stress UspA family protein